MKKTLADVVKEKKVVASREVMAKKANTFADRLASKLDDRMEKILFDAEELVKEFFPARYVSASLTKLQKALVKEGISCAFDKRVTKEAIKKTASMDITPEECDEAVEVIAKQVVAETEDTLEACDVAMKNLAKKHFSDARISSVRAMRASIEAKMKETGLNIKF